MEVTGHRDFFMLKRSLRYNTEKFIEKANKVHNNKYDYSKSVYKGCGNKIEIVCPIHGSFWQIPTYHLSGNGCFICGREKVKNSIRRYSLEDFKEKASKKHNNFFDYSKVEFSNLHDKVCIICPIHGEFWQSAYSHLMGTGCPSCSRKKQYDTLSFIEKAKEIHGNKYSYDKVSYINTHTKVEITCPKHGVFLQTPAHHLQGVGCPYCSISKGNDLIQEYLDYKGISYIREKRFKLCRNKQPLPFDFYLPDYGVCIEFQGEQHYNKECFAIGNRNKDILFKELKHRDKLKKKFCNDSGLILIEISYTEKNNISNILNNYLGIS